MSRLTSSTSVDSRRRKRAITIASPNWLIICRIDGQVVNLVIVEVWRTGRERGHTGPGLATVVAENKPSKLPVFPLTVEYREKSYTRLKYAGEGRWRCEEDLYSPLRMRAMLDRWLDAHERCQPQKGSIERSQESAR